VNAPGNRFLVPSVVKTGGMKRAIGVAVALGLTVPAAVGASTIAGGSLQTAIEKAASSQTPSRVPQRCLVVRVTTTAGHDWATVGFSGARYPSLCNRYGFNGVAVVRRVHGSWHFVTAGSAMIPCAKFGIPAAVQHDLRIPCAAAKPPSVTGPTSGVAFSPNAAGITCLINDNGTTQGAFVFCWLGAQWPPATHAKLALDGSVDKTGADRQSHDPLRRFPTKRPLARVTASFALHGHLDQRERASSAPYRQGRDDAPEPPTEPLRQDSAAVGSDLGVSPGLVPLMPAEREPWSSRRKRPHAGIVGTAWGRKYGREVSPVTRG
jgi:hypothetical protein